MAGQKRKLVILLTAFFLYLVVGAVIFWKLEDQYDPTNDRIKEVYERYNVGNRTLTLQNFTRIFSEEYEIIFKITHFGKKSWSFYTALYFCGSVVTTIGKYVFLPFFAISTSSCLVPLPVV